MGLTETDQDSSAAVLTESPNFSFISKARVHEKGGGVAILFNDSFHCRQMSYGKFASFEHVALKLNSSCSLFFYRPTG